MAREGIVQGAEKVRTCDNLILHTHKHSCHSSGTIERRRKSKKESKAAIIKVSLIECPIDLPLVYPFYRCVLEMSFCRLGE